MRRSLPAVLGLVAFTVSGCSISESVSKSISSPFQSISASSASSSPDRDEAYRSDVADYTVAFVNSGGNVGGFMQGLGSVAKKHGVTNWEADENTWVGIGRGLRKAEVASLEFEVYKTNLAKGDPVKGAAMQKGFDYKP